MADSFDATELKCRPTGATEISWCKAVPGGTGITVLSVLISKPIDIPLLQKSLLKLQISHPILKSKIHFDPSSNSFSYLIPQNPSIQLQRFDLPSTIQILQSSIGDGSISPHHLLLEHELNSNPWAENDPLLDTDVFFASLYELENGKWVLALRFHTSACDRASAAALLEELVGLLGTAEDRESAEDSCLGIEEYIPSGQANKPFWARAADMMGYSLNFLRFSNLEFMDSESPRMSRVARLQISEEETDELLSRCESEEIKLSAVIAAAGLIAAHSSKQILDEEYEKYCLVALIDCRPLLDPVLTSHNIGFYHSAILNSHDVRGGESLWVLAKRVYSSFVNAKSNRKHFTDMSDLNFLMCKAIDNPGLTPSGSLRTSLITIFEEPMIDRSDERSHDIGLEDFVGCSSVHGIGPSIAIFDTIRDGRVDCACVYPFPLHSREQIQELVDEMKKILVDGAAQKRH